MKDFQSRVEQWAADRNLIQGSTPEAQFDKLDEETSELLQALRDGDRKEQIDAIGDCCVVLAIIAKQIGSGLSACQEAAWEEIKDRKGRLENGVFVKDA